MIIRDVMTHDWLAWERMRYALWPGDDETHGEVTHAFLSGMPRNDPAAVLLAEDESGKPIAFAELSIRKDLPGLRGVAVGYIEGMYVEAEARHRGLARQLIVAAREWAAEQGCSRFASDRDDRVIVDPVPLVPTRAEGLP